MSAILFFFLRNYADRNLTRVNHMHKWKNLFMLAESKTRVFVIPVELGVTTFM